MASLSVGSKDDQIHQIAATIRVIPDFPKPEFLFQDITTLLLDPKEFKDTIDLFVERYKDKNINIIAGFGKWKLKSSPGLGLPKSVSNKVYGHKGNLFRY